MALVAIRDILLNVRRWGPPSGPPVLFLHGLGANADCWFNQVPAFSPEYDMIAVDMRGFGRSSKPAGRGAYSLDNFVEDAAALIRHLNLPPCHVVGTSMGGFIAQRLCLDHPALVASATLCHTADHMTIPADVMKERLKALAAFSGDDYAQLVVNQALGARADEVVREWLREMLARNDLRDYGAVLEEAVVPFDLGGAVEKIEKPCLVLVGKEDRIIPADAGRALFAKLRNAKLAELPHSGHLGYIEEPTLFNRTVLEFLKPLTR